MSSSTFEERVKTELNKEQRAAVVSFNNPIRIIAGAGSGKTKVLTWKISYLVEVAKFNPSRVVALTFTNKAANEMKERVEQLIGNKINNMIISTFHSLCYRFLIEEMSASPELGLKNFAIIDGVDQDNILKDVYKEYDINKIQYPYNQMKEFISSIKINFRDINELESEAKENNDEIELLRLSVFKSYQNALIRSKSLDFNDLLIYTKKILENYENIKEKWRSKFDYFLIDEFQDTSKIQYDIIDLLMKNKNNITIVGDPDQTIYGWRGADITFINEFDKLYENVITITLSQNYRSTKNILKAANSLIMNNANRLPKNLLTENEEGSKITFYEASHQGDEASWVAMQIEKLMREKNKLNSIAILYRSNFYSKSMEDALIKKNLSYKVINGQKFYERAEIKDALAYLRCIYEPTDISLSRIINVPSRKLGDTTIEQLKKIASHKNKSIWDLLQDNIDDFPIQNTKKLTLLNFVKTINKYKALINECKSISETLEKLLSEVGFMSMHSSSADFLNTRYENIVELIASIRVWEQENQDKTIKDYLDNISLESLNLSSGTDQEYISMMTIHAAKGLEFDNVFVIGLSEGVFPSYKVTKQDSEELLEEERRLAYVAITRARKNLFLSFARETMGSQFSNDISRFIKETNIELSSNLFFDSKEINISSKLRDNDVDFEPGDRVTHVNFGEGIVLDIIGDSIIIEFINKKIGTKQLLKNHKSIERIG